MARYILLPCLALAAACGREFEGGGELRATRVTLEREVEGLRQVVQDLERGEPLLPPDDIAIAIEDTLVRDLITAQLPFDADVNRFHLTLADADVQFRGSPVVRLHGHLQVRDQPGLTADVTLLGALVDIAVDPAASTLRAKVAADHLTIENPTGLGQFLSGSALDEAARLVRLEIADQLPAIEIPVKVRQQIDFAPVTSGPVRLAGARLPLEVAVSQVRATRGRLWISVRVTPGDFVKLADAPEAGDSSAAEAGATLDDTGRSPSSAPRKGGRTR